MTFACFPDNEIEICQGWLLGREYHPHSRGVDLIYWLSTEHGPRCLTVKDQPYQAMIRQSEWSQWQAFLQRYEQAGTGSSSNKPSSTRWRMQATQAQDFQLEPVAALYVYSPKLWQAVKQQAERSGWILLEADIRPCDRYLMARFICGALQAKVQDNHILAARSAKPTHQPSMVSLDLECSRYGELFSIGLYSEHDRRVLMIGADHAEPQAPAKQPDYLHYVADEAALLRGLLDWFEQFDPDVIIGWSVASFDLNLLHKRANHCGIKLSLGRDGSEPRWHPQAGAGRECALAGRAVLDGIEWLRAAFYQFDSFSLEHVAQQLLGEGKASCDPNERLAEIEHNFVHDKLALAQYNLKDCELVWRIFEHTQLLAFALARSQMTGLELDRLGGSVAAFTHRYLPHLHRAGFVAPNLTAHSLTPSPGGYVMDSIPGKYRNVLVLDYKSLYPSIIRSFLIDPMGMVAGLAEPDPAMTVVGYRGARFHRLCHRLPAIITELASEREQAKLQEDQPLSQAIKILMNSFYGVLGASGCRFHDPRLASSITLRGHDIMQRSKMWIENAGYRVIYGDTDSIFVHIGDEKTTQQAQIIGQQLTTQVNKRWQQLLAEQNLTSALELEFETHYHHFFMPTIRGSQVGSKKRYVGAVEKPIDANKIDLILTFKGMETVRSDWTPLAREFQQTLYRDWFLEKPIDGLIKTWVQQTRQGQRDHQLIYTKRLRRDLEQYHANAPHVQAARRANQYKAEQKSLCAQSSDALDLCSTQYRRGMQIGYLITDKGAWPIDIGGERINYEHYIDKQLKPIAEPILQLLDIRFKQLLTEQLGLF